MLRLCRAAAWAAWTECIKQSRQSKGGRGRHLPPPYVYPFLALLLFLFLGCGALNSKLEIFEANFYFSRGMVNEAISKYLSAAENQETAPYAHFALGTIYLALEQHDAALERFIMAEKSLPVSDNNSASASILYKIRYNACIVHFEKGEYREAAASFKGALEIDRQQRNAKRNLELSFLLLDNKSQNAELENNQAGSIASGSRSGSSGILFDYMRRKEMDKWKSIEWTGTEDNTGPDY